MLEFRSFRTLSVASFLLASSLFSACGSDKPSSGFDDNGGTKAPDEGPGFVTDAGGVGPDLNGEGGSTVPGTTCAASAVNATRAMVDIIIGIDTSASMVDEINQLQMNLNAFAQKIGQSGLDYHVVLVASQPKPFPFSLLNLCIPQPLGG